VLKNNIALAVTVCIALFGEIGELRRQKLHQSRATAFNCNGQTRREFLQVKWWVPSSLLHHRQHRA